MRLFYDLHLHSCLSPCGDEESTPGNIAGMLKLAGAEIAALTDHNSCGNCRPFLRRAEDYGLIALPGMELTTSEEVHVICLFEGIDEAEEFSRLVRESLPPIPNNPGIFGEQVLCGMDDEPAGFEDRLLISATGIGIYDVSRLVRTYGGVAFPAHVDRPSFSLLANLGMWDDAMGFGFYEKTAKADPTALPDRPFVINSDAHRLEDIPDAANTLEVSGRSARAVLEALRELGGGH